MSIYQEASDDEDDCFLPNYPEPPTPISDTSHSLTSGQDSSVISFRADDSKTAIGKLKSILIPQTTTNEDAYIDARPKTVVPKSLIKTSTPKSSMHPSSQNQKRRTPSVSFREIIDYRHYNDSVDVKMLIKDAFRIDIKSPASTNDDKDTYTSSMMVSDLNLQQRVYLERKCGEEVMTFDRDLSLEEELQARVVQLREVGKTWKRKYNYEHQELQRLSDHLVDTQNRCEVIVEQMYLSFESVIEKLRLEIKVEQRTRAELLKERHILEDNFKQSLEKNEKKRKECKELKRNVKSLSRGYKQLLKDKEDYEKSLIKYQEENKTLQSSISKLNEEMLSLKDELNKQSQCVNELEDREVCYQYLCDMFMCGIQSDGICAKSSLNKNTSKLDRSPFSKDDITKVSHSVQYQLNVDDKNPCVMSLKTIFSDNTSERHANEIDINNNNKNANLKNPVENRKINPHRKSLVTARSLDDNDMRDDKNNKEHLNIQYRRSSVTENGTSLKRSDAFIEGNYQWKNFNADISKPARRKRPPSLVKSHTVIEDILPNDAVCENVPLHSANQVPCNKTTGSTFIPSVHNEQQDEIASGKEDVCIITRSEPALNAINGENLGNALNEPLDRFMKDTHVHHHEYNTSNLPTFARNRSPMLKSYSDDVNDSTSITSEVPSMRSSSESSAFAGLRTRRNGIVEMADIDLVKTTKKSKKQEFTKKIRRFAHMDDAGHKKDVKRKDRRSSNW